MKIWSNTSLLDSFKKHFDFVNDNKEADIVLDVMQRGYKIQDRVIRPALVIVNKK